MVKPVHSQTSVCLNISFEIQRLSMVTNVAKTEMRDNPREHL